MQQKDTAKARVEKADTALPALFSYIDGKRVAPGLDRGNSLRNPNTREDLQSQWSSSPEQVETALQCTDRAYQAGEWENLPPQARADVLDTIADRLDNPNVAERMAFGDAITTGAVIQVTRRLAQLAPSAYRAAANFLCSGALQRLLPGKLC